MFFNTRLATITLGAALLTLLVMPPMAHAQRDLTDIPVPDPAEELKTFVVADGFEVTLFAADPSLHKPIQMNFDPAGRLWVAASEVYPQIAPGQKANDKILILEDTDGDGRADKTTVFADGLLIPTAVIAGDGGAYVANSTELLHLRDTNGDGKADVSNVVLSGFGTEDTHHILHTFRWGYDGALYMNQSIYIHSHIETPTGVMRLNAGGIWRFEPETMRLDVFARGWVNTWGHHFDRAGNSFATDGAGGEGINYAVPGAAYPTADGYARILHGLNPGSPKHCGLEVVESRHLPDDWQGDMITNDFRGHRVCRFKITEDGSGFSSRQQPDLISSNHVAFRPIDVKQGPDGAIYIADWYNPIIQHGEVDFRDPRRDHTHGRIWRVTAKGRPTVPNPKLEQASNKELLGHLSSVEKFHRDQSKRVLRERGAAIDGDVAAFVKTLNLANVTDQWKAIEILWLARPDTTIPQLVGPLAKSSEAHIRSALARYLGGQRHTIPAAQGILENGVSDEHPRVRLESLRALTKIPGDGGLAKEFGSAKAALTIADRPMDTFLEYAAWLTIRELQPAWEALLQKGELPLDDQYGRLIYAIEATNSNVAMTTLAKAFRDGRVANDLQGRVLQLLGSLGTPADLKVVFDLAIQPKTPADQVVTLLSALGAAAKARNLRPDGDLAVLADVLSRTEPGPREAALALAANWKLESLATATAGLADDTKTPAPVRLAAIATLGDLASADCQAALVKLASTDATDEIRAAATIGLMRADLSRSASLAANLFSVAGSIGPRQEVLGAFLNSKEGPAALATALGPVKIPEDFAKLAMRTLTGAGRQEPVLTEALMAAGSISSQPKMFSPAEKDELLALAKAEGNPAEGQSIFRRSELACVKCHAIGGAGGKVGPDMVSIGASAQPDYLLDSLLEPNKAVKENYHTLIISTDEGKVFSGIRLRESDQEIVLRDAEDREVTILKSTIDEQAAGSSLMPAGLVDKLTKAELVSLVRFLSELGKPGDYAVGTARRARVWEALDTTPEAWTKISRTSDSQVVTSGNELSWKPVYAYVNGDLPPADLPRFQKVGGLAGATRDLAFVRTWIDVTQAGEAALALNSTDGVDWWLNGEPLPLATDLKMPLTPGRHSVTLLVNLRIRQTPIRLEFGDVVGSPLQLKLAAGN